MNWDWMAGLDPQARSARFEVLNLFGYTGGATLACAAAGAKVTHVDAAKGMVQWAGENRKLAGNRRNARALDRGRRAEVCRSAKHGAAMSTRAS